MNTELTLKNQLSQVRKSVREQKKELKRLRDSRNSTKIKCNNLTSSLKIQKLRLKETKESRNRWKQDYKEEQIKSKELSKVKENLEKLLGLNSNELSELRSQIALEKKRTKTKL